MIGPAGARSLPRPPKWVVGAAALGLAAALATLVVALSPSTRLAERNLALQASYETAAALVAALVAYLLAGRYGRTHGRRDLVLAAGVSVLALSNLLFTAVPDIVGARDGAFAVWASTVGTVVAASALAVGGFLPERRLTRPRRSAALAGGLVLVVVAAIAAVVGAFDDRLPVGVSAQLAPDASELLSGDAWLVGANAAAGVAYAAAAAGFFRRAAGDELMRWFAAGAMLAAFARLNYVLLPTSLSAWLSTGDLMRMGFYLLLLAGAVREIRAYQRGIAGLARVEERRRVARELHDGLAQELAYIATATEGAAAGVSPRRMEMLGVASRRAMVESRMLIEALAADPAPLDRALREAASEIGSRSGLEVEVDVPSDLDVSPRTHEALTRIVREAVNNAARHAAASHVRVQLVVRDGIALSVADDGCGFDPDRVDGGFGLTSMRERARAVGGELRIESRPDGGTEVRLVIP